MENNYKNNPYSAENSQWYNQQANKWAAENAAQNWNKYLPNNFLETSPIIQSKIEVPNWDDLLLNYPDVTISTKSLYDKIGAGLPKLLETNPDAYENSCAIRMSYGLNYSGSILPKRQNKKQEVKLGKDGYYYWLRVRELYPILRDFLGTPTLSHSLKIAKLNENKEKLTPEDMNKYSLKKGIIMFEISGWTNATGHFTLWDGENLLYAPGHDNNNSEFYYFHYKEVRGNNVIQTNRITLWELN